MFNAKGLIVKRKKKAIQIFKKKCLNKIKNIKNKCLKKQFKY